MPILIGSHYGRSVAYVFLGKVPQVHAIAEIAWQRGP
jgi:hypothetical protein